jgi:hypothetical protein
MFFTTLNVSARGCAPCVAYGPCIAQFAVRLTDLSSTRTWGRSSISAWPCASPLCPCLALFKYKDFQWKGAVLVVN